MLAAVIDMEHHEPDSEAAEEADRRFHEALAMAAGNELMSQLTATISVSVGYVARAKRQGAEHRDSTDDHRRLMEAIESADPTAARAIATRIISRGLADLHLDR
jgi:DNA-binding FadR family transcriptional regulator